MYDTVSNVRLRTTHEQNDDCTDLTASDGEPERPGLVYNANIDRRSKTVDSVLNIKENTVQYLTQNDEQPSVRTMLS